MTSRLVVAQPAAIHHRRATVVVSPLFTGSDGPAAAAAAQSQAGPGGGAQAQFVPGEPQVGERAGNTNTKFHSWSKVWIQKDVSRGK